MPSRRCGLCGIQYPAVAEFINCPLHGEPTMYEHNVDVDENWDWKATAILARINEGVTEVVAQPLLAKVKVTKADDQFWIKIADVLKATKSAVRLDTGDVLEIPETIILPGHPCGCMWEIMGYSESRRAYWVRPLRVPNYIPL